MGNDKSNYKLQCLKCGLKFRFPSRLIYHERLIHSGLKFECSICDKVFKRKSSYDLHLQTHTSTFQWEECEICSAKFVDAKGLNTHIQVIHYEGLECQFNCVFCERGLPSLRDFERHIRSHIREKPYFCNICGKEMGCQYSRDNHVKTHAPKEERPRPFQCNRCPKNYETSSGLSNHIQSFHLELKPHKCELCEKKFTLKSALTSHFNRVHTDIARYPCTYCPKKFKDSTDLKRHLVTHTGEQNYICKYCNRAFGRRSARNKHEEVVHEKKK